MAGLYAAGDVTGVEEASIAMEEGRLAGIAAASACGRMTQQERDALCAKHIASLQELESGEYDEGRGTARAKKLELFSALKQ